jgi:Cys-tRNA(Pro)/Cys-tRNA(Cys) deacylase
MISNNVTRLLDAHKIHYTAFEMPVEKLGALETAEILDISPSLVYKTIVIVRPKGKPVLCAIAGDNVVDLKAVADFIGEKKVSIPTQNEAEALTGLQAGGISPLALINKGFAMLIDQTARDLPEIHISGGQRGLILRLNPLDLQKLTGARFALVSTKKS